MAKMKKSLAIFLVFCMCMSMCGMTVVADDSKTIESGASSKPNATVTIKVEEVTNTNNEVIGEKTTTENNWSSTTPETNPATSTTNSDGSTTTVNSSVITEVTGSETKVDNEYFDETQNGTVESNSVSGNETTSITNTTTTTNVGQVEEEIGNVELEKKEETKKEDWVGLDRPTTEGEWVRDAENDVEGALIKDDSTESTEEKGKSELVVGDNKYS